MTDLLKIEAFLRAAENLNFTEAARQMHLSQPTVSHHIKSLEHELSNVLLPGHSFFNALAGIIS
jgi:DNA-binding transcriptional LysR family regulator